MTTEIATVECCYPDRDSYPEDHGIPEGYDEWRPASGRCTHDHCIEGDRMGRLYARTPRLTPDEIEATKADLELVADEYGGLFRE